MAHESSHKAGLSLPPLAVALLAVTAGTLVTGALHEDGFADVADGFGGGRDAEAKRRIMRDSRIGSYGVMGLILLVGLKVAALSAIPNGADAAAALVASHALGRAVIPALSHFLPFAAPDGLARLAGTAGRMGVLWAGGLGLALAIFVLPAGLGIYAVLSAVGAAAAVGWLAHRQIGGATGDVFGAAALLAETAALLAISAGLGNLRPSGSRLRRVRRGTGAGCSGAPAKGGDLAGQPTQTDPSDRPSDRRPVRCTGTGT